MHSIMAPLGKWGLLIAVVASFLYLPSANAASRSSIPNADIRAYCAEVGCDNQVFYSYYQRYGKLRYCSASKQLLGDRKRLQVLRYVMRRSIIEGLPPTTALLPLIESSLNPVAVASGDNTSAKGLWQFQRGTASDMGLKVHPYGDERLDIRRSTDAGMSYMAWLTREFNGDHNLAVLAYHVGIGKVNAMIKTHRTRNAWYLSQLLNKDMYDTNYLSKYHAYALALAGKGC